MLKKLIFSILLSSPLISLGADESKGPQDFDCASGVMLRSILTLTTSKNVTPEETHALVQEAFYALLKQRTDVQKKVQLPETPLVHEKKLAIGLLNRSGRVIKPPLQRPISLPAPRGEPKRASGLLSVI
jgi:hypothetical protein